MRILVVEDKRKHQESARETLADHEVTIATTFDQAMEFMRGNIDGEETFNNPLPFEVVLTDMMMPMSKENLMKELFNPSEQVPYGFIIALRATLRGARFVAMVTDTNHHHGAMSAAIDHLGSASYRDGFKPNFVVNGAKVMFVHTPFVKDFVKDAPCTLCRKNPGICFACDGTGISKNIFKHEVCGLCSADVGRCSKCKGTTKADQIVEERKDWGQVFRDLISEIPTTE